MSKIVKNGKEFGIEIRNGFDGAILAKGVSSDKEENLHFFLGREEKRLPDYYLHHSGESYYVMLGDRKSPNYAKEIQEEIQLYAEHGIKII